MGADHGSPDHALGGAGGELEKFRLARPVLQIDQRTLDRIAGELLAESRELGGDPMVDEDHAGIGVVQRTQHR